MLEATCSGAGAEGPFTLNRFVTFLTAMVGIPAGSCEDAAAAVGAMVPPSGLACR